MNFLNSVGGCWRKICFVISPKKISYKTFYFLKSPKMSSQIHYLEKMLIKDDKNL